MGQSSLRPPLSGAVCLHGLWVLAVVCGLSAPIVGPFVCNVVLQRFLFALIMGSNLTCLRVHAIIIVGRYTYRDGLLMRQP